MKHDFNQVINRKNTDSVKWDNNHAIFGTDDLHPMWIADMDFVAPPQVLSAMEKRLQHGVFGYTFRGDDYHHAIMSWVKRRYHWEIHRDWITFSPGIVPAISMSLLAYTNPGDKVVIQTPVYAPFSDVINANGRLLVENPLLFEDGVYKMDFDGLETLIDDSTKMLILCSPHNPIGRVWTKAELIRLGEIVIKHNLIIVSDEIHADFVFSDHEHFALASLSNELEQRTITCYAPSKTFGLAGLTTSFLVIPNTELREGFNHMLEALDVSGGNIFGTVALTAAYDQCEDWLDELMVYLEDNANHAVAFFNQYLPAIKPVRPEGTYLLWLDCSALGFKDADELTSFFTHKAKVGLNRGIRFGKQSEQFVRMNIGCPRTALDEGLNRIKRAVENLE